MSDNTITVDASSVPATITTSGHTSDLRVPVADNLLFSFKTAGATGTSPTLDVYVDYSDGAGNVIAVGVVHLAQFTGAGATFSNVGPVAGGGGFILPPAIQIRWVLGGTGSPSFTGVAATVVGR